MLEEARRSQGQVKGIMTELTTHTATVVQTTWSASAFLAGHPEVVEESASLGPATEVSNPTPIAPVTGFACYTSNITLAAERSEVRSDSRPQAEQLSRTSRLSILPVQRSP